jgi:effector-binding domain-containing protein
MFKIGEFSRMSGLSINTLYHYDNIGILKPMYIDKFTGYRYYDANQLVTINKIIALKDAGFSLVEIGDFFKRNSSNESLIEILEVKAESLEKVLELETSRLQRLRTNIFLIKNGGIPNMNEISIKKVEKILVASLRKCFIKDGNQSYDEFCESIWTQLNEYIYKVKGKCTIPCMTLYHEDTTLIQDMEVVEPITKLIPEGNNVKIYELPTVEKMACIVHNGSFATIGKTYGIIYKWISENKYSICGPIREIYHEGEWVTDDPNKYVTELQFPIK